MQNEPPEHVPAMRMMFALVFGLLPASAAKNRLLRLVGYEIHSSARISPSLFLNIERLTCAEGVVILAGSCFKSMARIELGEGAIVGRWNTISASPIYRQPGGAQHRDLAGALMMGRFSYITNRHYVDCSGGVVVEDWAAIAGVRSVVLSHTLVLDKLTSRCDPVRIGAGSFVGSCCSIAPGSLVPRHCVVAMSSFVRPGLFDEECLYAGLPAQAVKREIGHWEWFSRPPYTGVEEFVVDPSEGPIEPNPIA